LNTDKAQWRPVPCSGGFNGSGPGAFEDQGQRALRFDYSRQVSGIGMTSMRERPSSSGRKFWSILSQPMVLRCGRSTSGRARRLIREMIICCGQYENRGPAQLKCRSLERTANSQSQQLIPFARQEAWRRSYPRAGKVIMKIIG